MLFRPGGRVDNIVFLKTHKTGGGTLACIFSRYCDTKGLEIAIPMKELSRFSWPSPFSVEEVDIRRLKKEKANILAHHAVYRFKSEFQKVMLPGAKFVTILRNPIERFESQFFFDKFYKLFKEEKEDNLLLAFLNAKNVWSKLNMTFEQREILRLFRNGMLFDLTGEQLDEETNQEDFEVLIKEIENDFDIVLLMEYFDEGLVLLRKLFDWNFFDLVYKRKNVRRIRHRQLINDEVRNKITALNKGDIKLYNHFLTIFQDRLKSYGNSFNRHLDIFRYINMEVNTKCQHNNSTLSTDEVEESLDRLQLTKKEYRLVGDISRLSPCLCSQLFRDEASYIRYFKRKFKPYYYIIDKSPPTVFCN